MSEVHKILIIENQFEHFSKLYKGLTSSGELVVIPSFENNDKKPYIGLMSAVKVFVNGPGYSKKYRNECWEIIKETLIDKEGNCSVDLIIMDNKLGGATVCQDGLDMAKLIWNINDNSNITKTIPILFLSRTDYSDEKRFTMFEEFRKNGYRFDWLMKGFLGNKPLEDGFIQITVKNKILELLAKESPSPKPENPNAPFISNIRGWIEKKSVYPGESSMFEDLIRVLEDQRYVIKGDDDEVAKSIDEIISQNRVVLSEKLKQFIQKYKQQ